MATNEPMKLYRNEPFVDDEKRATLRVYELLDRLVDKVNDLEARVYALENP